MSEPKKPLLLVHPGLNPPGGGNAVGAWALQALVETYDVTLVAWRRFDLEKINAHFGTSLKPGQFKVCFFPQILARLIDWFPMSLALLEGGLLHRYARRIRRRMGVPVALCSQNEADLGAPAIQYVHFPWAAMPRPTQDLRPIHRVPGFVTLYRALAIIIGGDSMARIKANRTLANSGFMAALVHRVHGIDATVLYPPVPGDFPDVDWSARENGVVAIGRFSGEKHQLQAVEVVAAARAQGADLQLHLVGSIDDPVYSQALFDTQRRHSHWMHIHVDLPRDAMLRLVAGQRYGLHMMRDEHFGIAVAELQRAGCVTFAHDSGGPREILGGDAPLLFSDEAEAVKKLVRVVGDTDLQRELRSGVSERKGLFTAERFCVELRRHVAEMAAAG